MEFFDVRVDVITLFPELFTPLLTTSFVGHAIGAGIAMVHLRQLRDFGVTKHRSVDDTPYGGGSGMVLRVDVVVPCLEAIDQEPPGPAHRILLTPQGAPLVQKHFVRWAGLPRIALLCGRYEGFDERVRRHVHEEISLGDFVMTGGEVAAMAIIEGCFRLLPGVLGNEASTVEESHGETGLLEYPQYTRPSVFRGEEVPQVLAGGNHAEIAKWRARAAEERTRTRRPDLYERYMRGRGEK